MERILYRIYTQDSPDYRSVAEGCVSSQFSSYTLFSARGSWEHTPEHSLIIEIIGTLADAQNVKGVATLIRGYNNQEAVLVTRTVIEMELV